MGTSKATSGLMDCNHIHHELQLSLYRFILEEYHDIPINKMTVMHLKNSEIEFYPCQYHKSIIEELFTYDREKLAKEAEENLTKEYVNPPDNLF